MSVSRLHIIWRKFTAWLVLTPVERERFEHRWGLIDRIFRVASWALIIGAYAALARKPPHYSPEQWVLGAIGLGLCGALLLAVASPFALLLETRPPAPTKGFFGTLRRFLIFIAVAAILLGLIWAVQFTLLAVLSAGKLP